MSAACSRSSASAPVDPHGAEVADVERDGVGAARPVLGERARRVRERHVPAAEGDHLGAERAVLARRAASGAARLTEPGDSGSGVSSHAEPLGPSGGVVALVEDLHVHLGVALLAGSRTLRFFLVTSFWLSVVISM